ncbi:MAG: flagellar filament capping protein FliD, partial [Planctomycetes bacterium]|nr:flagellar filament capping protein FliD [Planctomycetota bacterium]
TQVGLTLIAQSGGKLKFDETKFREAFEQDPDAVNELFTRIVKDEKGKSVQVGVAGQLDQLLSRLTSSVDGTLTLRNKTLQDEIDQYIKRQEELQERIDAKEAQLYAKFYAMETALASLQSQQSALTSLSALVSSATA